MGCEGRLSATFEGPRKVIRGSAAALAWSLLCLQVHAGATGWAASPGESLPSANTPQAETQRPQPGRDAFGKLFWGPGGHPLPFTSDDEVLLFLRTARVVSSESIPWGVTHPNRLLLEKGGIEGRAIYRDVAIEKMFVRLAGSLHRFFRDHYVNEVAAYSLSRLLELHAVPPAVKRRVRRGDGSLQLWLEGSVTELEWRKQSRAPLEQARHNVQLWSMRVFDNLVNNTDRNLRNYVTDTSGKVWYIDHTRCFSRVKDLPNPDHIGQVARGLWRRLQALPEETIKHALKPYLGKPEVSALLERRRKLVALIRERITQQGEDAVLLGRETPGQGPE
jgi:hypothetical protein